ncbi:SDR family NAD(P)-dependent oxidoreductase [Peribacillus sp. SCS-37]|uniref:SDR family NAD(P)-dependent oxidoreductase n=1 Tax=Paraperibacillus esterisolvens TaxID=3115296 RepID=UPI0039067BB7
MAIALITGTSSGLGEACGREFINRGIGIASVSRQENLTLKELAEGENVAYYHFPLDLSKTDGRELRALAEEIFHLENENLFLINNAGTVKPIAPAGSLVPEQVSSALKLNYEAPVLLINALLHGAKERPVKLNMMNITSGAGERAVHGWSIYGSTKAALNSFTETAALELANQGLTHHLNAFSPGIMDTGMQEVIRSASREFFDEVENFQAYKENGQLKEPAEVAECLVALMTSPTIESGKIYYARDLLK